MWRYRQPGVAFQLLNELQRQQQCNILCDTLLQTEGMSVPVHSCILAAFSPFLYRELSTSPSYPMGPRRLIRVPAIGAQSLLKLISYMYSGEMKGLGPTEHDEVKAAFIRLGMSHLIQKFEDDSRQWRDIDRGLLMELEGGTQTGTENGSISVQTPGGKSLGEKATQTEARSTVHAATQTTSRDVDTLSYQWLPPLSDGHKSTASTGTLSAEVSPTAAASTFVILTPVSDPSVHSDNVASCQVSVMSSPTVHCDPPMPRIPASHPSDTLNPSFENLSDDLFASTVQPGGSVESILQVGNERANPLVEAITAGGPRPGEQVIKDDASEQSTSKVRRSERLMTIKEKEVPVKDKTCTLDEPVKRLKLKFKRKCKNALWEIETPMEDAAMMANLSCSSATAAVQKDHADSEERLNGSIAEVSSHNPSSANSPTHQPATSNQTGPSIQNKAPPSPTQSQPEECDEQMDKLLDDIMMDLNFLLPIPTERGDVRLQQRPLPYLPSDPPGLDSTPWLGDSDVSMVNTQMEKGVNSDPTVVSQLGTSFTDGVGYVNKQSSCRFSQVRSTRSHTSAASSSFTEMGENAGIPPDELGHAHLGWSHSYMPDLEEMRLRNCLSPLQSEDDNIHNQPKGKRSSSGVSIPPWLSLTPVDLRYPLDSILLKSSSVTKELEPVMRTRRQKLLLSQDRKVPDSEAVSGASISGPMASCRKEENLVRNSVDTRKQSLEKESAGEREKSLRKGLRRLMAKRKNPFEENCERRSVGMSTGVGLKDKDSNVRCSSISAGKRKRRISTTQCSKEKEDLSKEATQKQGGGNTKSAVGLESSKSVGVPKRKRGRPPKHRMDVSKSCTITTPHRLTPKTDAFKQWTQISSKHRQGQEDKVDSLTTRKSEEEAPNQNESGHQCSEAAMKFQGENGVQKDVAASSSQLKPSETLKRFRELLERKGCLMKRKRSATDERAVQNPQSFEKDINTRSEIIKSAETDKSPEQTKAATHFELTRPFAFPANKSDAKNQRPPPQNTSRNLGAKMSRARKWTEGSTGSCDDEEDQEDEDLEEDVDVLSGSPVNLPVFEQGLVGREPSDMEEIDEDVDIITVDID